MIDTLNKVIEKGISIGIVSGSDLVKVTEQVGQDMIKRADYTFSENGLVALKKGEKFASRSIKD
jgi:phosphomannomutase